MKSKKQGCFSKIANDKVCIDINSIPQHTKEALASMTLDFLSDLLKKPGGQEMLDAKKAELFD